MSAMFVHNIVQVFVIYESHNLTPWSRLVLETDCSDRLEISLPLIKGYVAFKTGYVHKNENEIVSRC
jgi:hypothetical protein